MIENNIALFFMAGWPHKGRVVADGQAVLVFYPPKDEVQSILTLAYCANDNGS